MHPKVAQAIEQDELRQVLSQTAYSYFGEKMAIDRIRERVGELNNNSDAPLEKDELKEIVDKAKEDRKSKKNDNGTPQISFAWTNEIMVEQIILPIQNKGVRRITGRGVSGTTNQANLLATNRLGVFNIKDEKWEVKESIEIGGIEYKPVTTKLFRDDNRVVIFPSGIEKYGEDKDLIKEIREFIHDYLEVGSFYEKILPFFVLFTWVHDAFPFTAYLHFVGVTSTGKTRAIDTLSEICYKAIRGTGSATASSLFRVIDQFQGTLLLNEFELGKSVDEGYNERLQLLKAGSENYSTWRTEGDSKTRDVETYFLKCPKVFAGEKPFTNAALVSRTIVVPMSKKTRRIPLYTVGDFYTRAEKIRNKLLLWRFRHLPKINMQDMQFGFDELQGFDSRLQQVITPIYYLASEESKLEITGYLDEMQREIRESRREEPAGIVLMAYLDNLDASVTDITNLANKNGLYDKKPRAISEILTKELGLITNDNNKTHTAKVIFDPIKIDEFTNHYGLEEVSLLTEKVRLVRKVRKDKEQGLDISQDVANLFGKLNLENSLGTLGGEND